MLGTPAGTAALHTAMEVPEVSLLQEFFRTGQGLELMKWDGIHQLTDLIHDTAELLLPTHTWVWQMQGLQHTVILIFIGTCNQMKSLSRKTE